LQGKHVSCSRRRVAKASIQNTTARQDVPACAAFDDWPAYAAASSCPDGWIPAFDTCWPGHPNPSCYRDEAFVPRRRVSGVDGHNHFRRAVADCCGDDFPPRVPRQMTGSARPRLFPIAIPIRRNHRAIAGRHRRPRLIADGKTKKVHFSF